MLRFTAFLVVVTLTGLPVAPTACLVWCGDHRTTSGVCHDEAVNNGSPVVTAADGTCAVPVTESPFIREDARPVLHAVPALFVARALGPTPTAHLPVGYRQISIDAPSRTPLVLRL